MVQFLLQQGPLRALAYPQYRLLWGASLFSIVSFFMVLIARGWLILEMTDSPFMVTAVNAVPMIPTVVLSPFGGAMADRLSRRAILVTGEVVSVVALLAMALLLMTGQIQVWHVFALAIMHGMAFATIMPARAATVPDVVSRRDLASGVALFSTIFSAAQLAGPAPAGFLIEQFGMAQVFFVATALSAGAGGLAALLRLQPQPPRDGTSVMASIVEGFVYVRGQRLLLGLLLLGLVFAVFGMPYQAILPVFARDILHRGADGLGLLGAAVGLGALAGSITVASFSDPRQVRFLMVLGGIGFGVVVVLFAFSPIFWLSFGLTILLGYMMQTTLTANFTVVQVESPPHMRGRVLSIRMIALGLGPVGMFLLGAGAESIGPPTALALMGVASVVLTLVLLALVPAIYRVETAAQEKTPQVSGSGLMPVPPVPAEHGEEGGGR